MEIKLFSVMNAEERQEWLEKFQKWVSEELPEIEAGNMDVSSMERGFDLLLSFGFCKTMVREARAFLNYKSYVRPVRRCVNKISAEVQKQMAVSVDLTNPSLLKSHVGRPTKDEQAARALAATKERKEKEKQTQTLFGDGGSINTPEAAVPGSVIGSLNAFHVDQLRWLMSDSLKAEADTIRDLRSQAAEAATRAKQMAEDGCSEDAVAEFAQAAATYTEQYERIYNDIDREMAYMYVRLKEDAAAIDFVKSQGVDPSELRTQLRPYWDKVENKEPFKEEVITFIKDNDPAQAELREAEEEKQKKIKDCIKYIMRKDKENTPKRIEGIQKRIEELVELVGEEEAKPYYAILDEAKSNPAPARKDKK